MKRHILAGLVLALLTTAIVLFSGPELQGVALLGAALGGALGLVPDRSPAQRAAGFGVGFLAAWLGYALRAAVLPDAAAGRAIAVLVVVLVCLGVAALTRGRLPLWSALLGAADHQARSQFARIVSGLSLEGIALDLHVSPTTAATFRRRAYAKLEVSSQNELFAHCAGLMAA